MQWNILQGNKLFLDMLLVATAHFGYLGGDLLGIAHQPPFQLHLKRCLSSLTRCSGDLGMGWQRLQSGSI